MEAEKRTDADADGLNLTLRLRRAWLPLIALVVDLFVPGQPLSGLQFAGIDPVVGLESDEHFCNKTTDTTGSQPILEETEEQRVKTTEHLFMRLYLEI